MHLAGVGVKAVSKCGGVEECIRGISIYFKEAFGGGLSSAELSDQGRLLPSVSTLELSCLPTPFLSRRRIGM